MRLFDLNIETVLDHWDVHHGICEVIYVPMATNTK